MQSNVEAFLDRRRRRAISAILGVKERHIDPLVDEAMASRACPNCGTDVRSDVTRAEVDAADRRVRGMVVTQVNEFHDLLFDLTESLGQDAVVNQHYLDLLEDLHRHVVKAKDDSVEAAIEREA